MGRIGGEEAVPERGETMSEEPHETASDVFITPWGFMRGFYGCGDRPEPNASDPSDDGWKTAVWSVFERAWLEADAHFIARFQAAVKDKTPEETA
jgi:hypothetical protein